MIFSYYENQVIQICSDYAAIAHSKQLRKDKKTPYITHPARVANLVCFFLQQHPKLHIYMAAAWLHDVMEDCSAIIAGDYSFIIENHECINRDIYHFLTEHPVITKEDGHEIFELAKVLTCSQNKDVPKKERKKNYYKKVSESDPPATVIKYADRIDNLVTAHIFTQKGFKNYLKDTKEMIEILGEVSWAFKNDSLFVLFQELKQVEYKYKEMYGEE
jgi:(p)ppGpp synthase/HD superfamily hydrolase